MSKWFEVDHDGLADIAKRRGLAFIVTEPIQNSWDEDTSRVDVELTAVPGKARVDLVVRDDSPEGFRDLTDSYKMFRTSRKLANPEQRGRFNIGEKLLLSIAEYARVESTKGSVIFGPKGRTTGRTKTETGSVLTARLKMTRDDLAEALKVAATLIPPPGIATFINGERLPDREPVMQEGITLSTEVQGEEGGFKYTSRKTTVRVYDTLPGEEAHIYEMGIPVDTIDCPWHVDIGQKVPLSTDRGSVRYGFQLEVQRKVAELMATRLTGEQSRAGWVSAALELMQDDDSVRAIIKSRFGEAVVYDPSSPESNKLAMDAGFTVVNGKQLTKAAWQTVRRAKALMPAGREFPDGRVRTHPDGVAPMDREQWTENMERVARYANDFAQYTIERDMVVEFVDEIRLQLTAACGRGVLTFNIADETMRDAIETMDQEFIDSVLIHECAHDAVEDHLTHAYHRECCRIGAVARRFDTHLYHA